MSGLRFDLITLRLFAAVAELGSLSRAAEREGIAVSALSKRVTDLERDLGATLLIRLPRGVETTPAGNALLHHAQIVMRSLRQLEGDLSEYATGVKGHVRMLVNESALVGPLPDELAAFNRQYPEIKIDLRAENSAVILRAIADRGAEIGIFTVGAGPPPGIQTIPYRSDRLALIVPSGHSLCSQPSVRFHDALEYDFVGLDVGSAWNALVTKSAEGSARSLRIRFRVGSFHAVCRLISAGLGIGLAPPIVLDAFTSAANLIAVPLAEEWATRDLMLCVRELAGLPMSARIMVRHLTAQSAQPAG